MNKKKLNIARKKVDLLDKKIFNLIKKRTQVVKHMLSLKRYKNQIVDHRRINAILKNIRNKSILSLAIFNFFWSFMVTNKQFLFY